MGEKLNIITERKNILEENLNLLEQKLLETPVRKTSGFSTVESILIAYSLYWTLVLLSPSLSFQLYPIYTDLGKIITETYLTCTLGTITILLFIGSWRNIILLRLFSLIISTGIWLVISTSIIQTNIVNMRGSVIILAVASAFQFIQVMKERSRWIK